LITREAQKKIRVQVALISRLRAKRAFDYVCAQRGFECAKRGVVF
jgi:hypothetical protein